MGVPRDYLLRGLSHTLTCTNGNAPARPRTYRTLTTVAREGRVIVTATNSQGEMVLGGVHDRETTVCPLGADHDHRDQLPWGDGAG